MPHPPCPAAHTHLAGRETEARGDSCTQEDCCAAGLPCSLVTGWVAEEGGRREELGCRCLRFPLLRLVLTVPAFFASVG